MDGVFLTGFNLFKHLVLGEFNWLKCCLIEDASLTFSGDVFLLLPLLSTAACWFLLLSSCLSSSSFPAGFGSWFSNCFSLIVPALLVLFLLDMASPLSITLTMLMFLPGLLAISCHTFTFWLTELTEFILETILLFVIVLGGGGRGWLVLGTIWLLPGAVFSLFSTLQLLG